MEVKDTDTLPGDNTHAEKLTTRRRSRKRSNRQGVIVRSIPREMTAQELQSSLQLL